MFKKPILIVNFKNYPEASGRRGLALALSAERVSKETGVNIAVAPPTPMLWKITEEVSIPVYAQHVDGIATERATGFLSPKVLAEIGVQGSIVNHSEHRVGFRELSAIVNVLKENGLDSVVCARVPREVSRYSVLSPSAIAIEPPELICSGIAVSKAKPELIVLSHRALKKSNPQIVFICGAGIVSGEDVKKAVELGSEGVLVASGIVKAPDPPRVIREMALALLGEER